MSHSERDRTRVLVRAICVLSSFGLLSVVGCTQAAGSAKVQRTSGSARAVSINRPCGVTWSGRTLLAGTADGVLRAVNTRTGWLTTPAGVGYTNYADEGFLRPAPDGSPARAAHFYLSCDAVVDHHGNLVLSDSSFLTGNETQTDRLGDNRVRVVAMSNGTFYGRPMTKGKIYTIAGNGSRCAAGTAGHPATGVALGLRTLFYQKYAPAGAPSGLRTDHAGNIVIAATNCGLVQVLAAKDGTFYGRTMDADDIYTIAGGGNADPGDGHLATGARLSRPVGVAVDHSGDIVIAESDRNRVRLVAARSGRFFGQQMVQGDIYTVAGGRGPGSGGDGGPARGARLDLPAAVAVDGHGNIAIADYGNHRVRLVAATSGSFYGRSMTGGDIYTIAGNGLVSFSGDRGPALRAQFGVDPEIGLPVAVDRTGNLLVSDRANLRVPLVAARSGELFGRRVLAGYVYTLAYCA